MRRAWRVWRTACVALVSTASLCLLALGAWSVAAHALVPPISVSRSPDGQLSLRVFSAGQSNVPPDYRADVQFVLRKRGAWFWSRDTLIARAALADGWAAPHAVTIQAGPLSWFTFVHADTGEYTVSVHVQRRSPEEARCVEQALTNAIDGILCFDGLIGARQAATAKPETP